MQVCMVCSTTAEETGRFCPSCGAVLAAGAVSASADAMARASTQAGAAGVSSTAASLVGTTVDGFAIEGVLGGGAFGTVYRGRQIALDRAVAIKVPTHEIAADPVMAKRFAREAKSASRVTHPGVVAIHGVGELGDGRPYLAMQLVEGEPLDKILATGPVPPARALEIARQIASALSETHASGVVHRDLKPSNIVWRQDRNGDDRITIVDFGIAVAKPGTAEATRLTSGGLIGTPHYMSPEQAHGEVVDARADLYALGCILFELLTGTTPFDGSAFEVLLAHLGRPAPRPSERVASVPPVVDQLVGALMAKRPDNRVASADAVVAMIDAALDELEGVRPPTVAPAPQTGRQRRKSVAPTRQDRPLPRAITPRPDLTPIPGAALAEVAPRSRPSPPPQRLRWIAFGAAGSLALCAAILVTVRLVGGPAAANPLPVAPRAEDGEQIKRVDILREDGDMRMHLFVPEVLTHTRMQRFRIELTNKLGASVAPETVPVTVQASDASGGGKATGLIARPRQANPAQLGFGYRFPAPGTYVVRVFPPETASSFEVELVVR